jgi:hypothetical protein
MRRGTHQGGYEVAMVVAHHPHRARLAQHLQHAVRCAVQQDVVFIRRVHLLQQLPAIRTDTGTGTDSVAPEGTEVDSREQL